MTNKLKRVNKVKRTRLVVILSVLFVILVTGATFAWLKFQTGEEVELNVGKVKLDTVINVKDFDTVVPGDVVLESSRFSKSMDGENCYVRALLNFDSRAQSLTRQEKNYLLAVNSYDNSACISTGVSGAHWLNVHDEFYYLVDDNNELIIVDDTTSYNFASNVVYHLIYEVMEEGLDVSDRVPQPYLDIKFQAIQSKHLPSSDINDVAEIFNVCFKTEASEEYLLRFNADSDIVVPAQVVKKGEKASAPVVQGGVGQATWYMDSACTIPFDFTSGVNTGCTLYVKWDTTIIPDIPTEEGLVFIDGAVVGYFGDEQKVVIPESYTLGERVLIEKTYNETSFLLSDFFKLFFMSIHSGYDCYPVTLTFMGEDMVIQNVNDMSQIFSSAIEFMILPPPIEMSYYIHEYEVSGDTQVTEIAPMSFINGSRFVEYYFELMGEEDFKFDVYLYNQFVDIVIPNTITRIGEMSFAFNSLNKLSIPNSVNELGEGMLYSANVKHLAIPSTVVSNANIFTVEGETAREYHILEVYNESDLEVNADNVLDNLNASIFYTYNDTYGTLYFVQSNDGLELIASCLSSETIELPLNGVRLTHLYNGSTIVLDNYIIGENAFFGNSNLRQVVINNNVDKIKAGAFADCFNLELMYIFNHDDTIVYDTAFHRDFKLKILVDNEMFGFELNNAVFKKDVVFLFVDSGYESITFEQVSDFYAEGVDEDDYKWIRVGQAGAYEYYTSIYLDELILPDWVEEITGYEILNNKIVGYSGSDSVVEIPKTNNCIKMFMSFTIEQLLGNSMIAEIIMLAGGCILELPNNFMLFDDLGTFEIFVMAHLDIGYIPQEDILNSTVHITLAIGVKGDRYKVTSIGENAFDSSVETIIIHENITSIADNAFSQCTNLTNVYYTSTAEDFAKIVIGSGNENLLNANITYNYGA